MAEAAGRRNNRALQRHLGQLRVTAPQQQQLKMAALCQGVAAKDPAWVDVLADVVSSAARAIQQQLAAQPGLVKDLATYVAHSHTSSSSAAGAPAVGASAHGPCATRSSSGKQQRGSRNSPQVGAAPSSSSSSSSSSSNKQLEAAAGALAHLLDCCGTDVPPPAPYQDLAPALHAALQQRLVCLPALAQALLRHFPRSMSYDDQLLSLLLDAAEQVERPATAVLAALLPLVLLGEVHPLFKRVDERLRVLLAGGTAAGAAFLAAAQLKSGFLVSLLGRDFMEAACSGLLAACREAASVCATTSASSSSSRDPVQGFPCLEALPPAHTVCLQYLRGLVEVVLHRTPRLNAVQSAQLAEVGGPLVPALAQALSLLLASMQLPEVEGGCQRTTPRDRQRPYHDAAWAALVKLGDCPEAAALVAAVFQHQPVLLEGLAASWHHLMAGPLLEEPAEAAAGLAAVLLLSGSIPDQEERQQQEQLMQAAVRVWGMPHFWRGRGDLLMEFFWLPGGAKAAVGMPGVLVAIFPWTPWWDYNPGLLDDEGKWDAFALLLEEPAFHSWMVQGLCRFDVACLSVFEGVWGEGSTGQALQLLGVPGMADALAQCCSMDEDCSGLEWILGDTLLRPGLQQYLAQQPQLLQALVTRLRRGDSHAQEYFWDCLTDEGSGIGWLLQQPVVLDGVVAALMAGGACDRSGDVLKLLLGAGPSMVVESLLRQPGAFRALVRGLGRHCQRKQTPSNQPAWQQLLVEKLAVSEQAPHVAGLLLGLLWKGSSVLSAGVFEAMNLMQRHMEPGNWGWCEDLAAASSSGTAVMCAEGHLLALLRGATQMQAATTATAAAVRQLQEQKQAAADTQAAAGDHLPGRRQGSRRLNRGSHQVPLHQQQQQQQGVVGLDSAAVARAAGSSSSSSRCKRSCKETGDKQAGRGAGSQRGAGGRCTPGKAATAPAAAAAAAAIPASVPGGDTGQCAGAPRASKRTRR